MPEGPRKHAKHSGWNLFAIGLAVLLLAGASGEIQTLVQDANASIHAASEAPAPPPTAAAPAYEVVASDLEVPWGLAFAPDGRIFVTERQGRIRVIENGNLRAEPWAEIDVEAVGEAGLTSIALPPNFAQSRAVYVLGTFRGASGLENRVVRLTDKGSQGTDAQVVVDGMPADRIYAGSALEFGPDGLLYVTVGDATEPKRVQDPNTLHGKLLRYQPDGTPASGNPLGGPVYAMGLRNVQGLDWHPSGELFASEHGPSGLSWEDGRTGDDEINRIIPGGNYAWPEVAGGGREDRFEPPVAAWNPAIAPSGLALYDGSEFPEWRGNAFLGALQERHLRRVVLQQRGGEWSVTAQEPLFENELGRIRAVKTAPDGSLYFTTSNRDGRGDPGP